MWDDPLCQVLVLFDLVDRPLFRAMLAKFTAVEAFGGMVITSPPLDLHLVIGYIQMKYPPPAIETTSTTRVHVALYFNFSENSLRHSVV